MLGIMIVEDEVFLQELYAEVLVQHGDRVLATAADGDQAVERFRATSPRPELVLMDHRMPGKDGLEAMREILAIDPGVQVVFLTADYSVAKAAMAEGAAGYISKPFKMEAMIAAVDHVKSRLKGKRQRGA